MLKYTLAVYVLIIGGRAETTVSNCGASEQNGINLHKIFPLYLHMNKCPFIFLKNCCYPKMSMLTNCKEIGLLAPKISGDVATLC